MVNKVEDLVKEIQTIQESCVHKWEVTGSSILRPSKVTGVHIGLDESLFTIGNFPKLDLKCEKYSTGKKTSSIRACPECLIPLKVREKLDPRGRECFLERDTFILGVRLSDCPQCKFSIVSDERD